jgi:uncharacterized protein with HEPN domain
MTAPREFVDYLCDIRDAAAKSRQFVAGMTFEQFVADEKTAYAVVRCLEIIGEAARKVPDTVRQRYPQMPWQEMMGMRNVLIHDYMGVNYRVVWNTLHDDLPPLLPELERMIAENK